jgi:hypothetical protein
MSTLNEIIESNIKMITEKEDFIAIFNFLHENNIKYTENDNGTFINLNAINKKTLQKLNDLINAILKN